MEVEILFKGRLLLAKFRVISRSDIWYQLSLLLMQNRNVLYVTFLLDNTIERNIKIKKIVFAEIRRAD